MSKCFRNSLPWSLCANYIEGNEMLKDKFFTQLGLYVVNNFLEPDYCRDICEELTEQKTVQSPLPEFRLGLEKEQSVSTRPRVAVDSLDRHKQFIESQLSELLPELEKYFQVELKSSQIPYFGVYDEGDFMNIHSDVVEADIGKDFGPSRIITVIINLNDELNNGMENAYCGGKLTFHGLLENEVFSKFGVPVKGKQGTLVAFPSTFLHEVTSVTRGKRYVINSAFY